jgi:chemotaxis signal transduction protein
MQMSLQIEEFLPFMPGVAKCERLLRELNFAWRLIESTAKMVCPLEAKTILPAMKATRDGFTSLETQLITNLVEESISKSVQEIHFKAQVVIDIVVRNLFERTADVGFLAMDDAIRSFILDGAQDVAGITERLRQYRDKYTVYDEILILDMHGKVLAHLDTESPVAQSNDPLIAQTLVCDTYVESFHRSDLRPAQDRALIYSRKITHPENGQAIGVLCLCFPLEVELSGVFAGLRRRGDRSVMLMLDRDGYAISSSDPEHIPPGRQLPLALDGKYQIVSHAGREYFAKTCAAKDYQGYGGPGWFGHVMIPFETAFRNQSADSLSSSYDEATLAGIMAHAESFCPPLHDVNMKAESINLALRRVVWNGKIMSVGEDSDLLRLKSILQEISQTGEQTSRVFKDSIQDLYSTVLSSSLQDLQFISRLMIGIMDRNLYERANDCRWWALTPDIRRLMASAPTGEGASRMTATLDAINALYTAYSRLVVFDTRGNIVSASNLHGDAIEPVGQTMEAELVRKTLSLRDSQSYCVSDFAPTWLYADRPTYIYCAAIFHPDDDRRVVGGIGIVFDSEPEFRNILRGSLPDRTGAFATLTDRTGRVISSTHADYPPGSVLRPAASMMSQENGASAAEILVHDGQYMMAGYTTSFGYREFKTTNDYDNDVISMVFVPVGEQTSTRSLDIDYAAIGGEDHQKHATNWQEFAIFAIGNDIFALPAAAVIEAVEAHHVHSVASLKPLVAGVLNYQDNSGAPSAFVPVVDMGYLIGPAQQASDSMREVILVRQGTHTLGLLVSELLDVVGFNQSQIEASQVLFADRPNYARNLIKTSNQDRLIQVLDFGRIVQKIFDEEEFSVPADLSPVSEAA